MINSVNGIILPNQYIDFMKQRNGGEGDIVIQSNPKCLFENPLMIAMYIVIK